MLRPVLLSAGAVLAVLVLASPADASDTCARATGGKCKPGQTAMAKPNAGTVIHKPTQRHTVGKGRNEYTAAEREKMMERARHICVDQFGASSIVYKIDYLHNKVWCEPPGF